MARYLVFFMFLTFSVALCALIYAAWLHLRLGHSLGLGNDDERFSAPEARRYTCPHCGSFMSEREIYYCPKCGRPLNNNTHTGDTMPLYYGD